MRVALALAAFVAACGGEEPCDPSAPGTICTIAGVPGSEIKYRGDHTQPALEAPFSLPSEVLAAPDGSLYISDWNNHRIRRLTPDGMVEWVAGQGEIGSDIVDLEADPTNQDFNHPVGLAWDCATGEDLMVAAWHNSMIRTIDLATGRVLETCGDGLRRYTGDGGDALEASLDLPVSIACDPAGDLVILDQANQVIRRVGADGIIETIAGRCIIDEAAPDGPGACDEPVPCPGSGKLTCGDPASTCGLRCADGYSGDRVAAAELRMAQGSLQSTPPNGRMVFEADGELLFADTNNHLIRRLRSDGIVENVAGTAPVDGLAQSGYAGDGGPALGALLGGPVDLALSDDGTIYFSDVNNHCVRAVDPDGTIRRVAGRCGEYGFAGDGGDPLDALLSIPSGLDWANGVLYIADTGNDLIRSIVLE